MTLTPKLKAQELVDKMYFVDEPIGNYPMCFQTAKQCALITVDELLTLITYQPSIDYYLEVKQEIQAL